MEAVEFEQHALFRRGRTINEKWSLKERRSDVDNPNQL